MCGSTDMCMSGFMYICIYMCTNMHSTFSIHLVTLCIHTYWRHIPSYLYAVTSSLSCRICEVASCICCACMRSEGGMHVYAVVFH